MLIIFAYHKDAIICKEFETSWPYWVWQNKLLTHCNGYELVI